MRKAAVSSGYYLPVVGIILAKYCELFRFVESRLWKQGALPLFPPLSPCPVLSQAGPWLCDRERKKKKKKQCAYKNIENIAPLRTARRETITKRQRHFCCLSHGINTAVVGTDARWSFTKEKLNQQP